MNFTDAIKVELLDFRASDLDVVNAARVSFDQSSDCLEDGDEKLVGYLLRNRHGSPFEHGYFKFRVTAPIFAFREHHRHRTGHSYNEVSGRYTELAPDFYVPKCARVQTGKPGHYVYEERTPDHYLSARMRERVIASYEQSWDTYQSLLGEGIAKEQARMVLPVGIFSKMIWSCNPRSLMHFLGLRLHPTAQKEIRMVAQQAEQAFKEIMPITYDAFDRCGRVAP